MRVKLLVPFLASMLVCGPAYAHHPFGATYIEGNTQIEGKLVSFELRNPHSFLQVDAKDEQGKIQRWTVEWASSSQLVSQGVSINTLKYGDVVTISGNPGRVTEEHKIRLVTILRKRKDFHWGGVR